MESKKFSSTKRISNQEEKIIREVDYDALAKRSRVSKKPIDKIYNSRPGDRKVVVFIKPKAPVIKTLYIAEKNKFTTQKHSERCGSRLAIGDHSSVTSPYSDENTTCVSTITCASTLTNYMKYKKQNQNTINPDESSSIVTKKSELDEISKKIKINVEKVKQCSACSRPKLIAMTFPNIKNNIYLKKFQAKPGEKIDIPEKDIAPNLSIAQQIFQKINYLEDRILQQEMVLHSINQTLEYSSSEEEGNKNEMKDTSYFGQPGCSYIEYSHIPKTTFQKHPQQSAEPLSISKTTTIRKEHNSEQYGRQYTLYDNVAARGRRLCASVPGQRNDVPKLAAERVHKIRHKLNPVRDYRLMDTVHYLAQGEFAPRDDGIKLTPSREAVLSDIIWEDVCRTHWPNTRLARKAAHAERCSTRSDLQRLIDSLLRERVAHIERRRRRHYRVVKLNQRHENCQPLGKTGDIIVANHKNKHKNDENNILIDKNTEKIQNPRRLNRSCDRITKYRERSIPSECSPGPSHAVHLSGNKKQMYCYHAENSQTKRLSNTNYDQQQLEPSSISIVNPRNPRLVIKKNSSLRRYRTNEPNLEHFILLPTLVVRTPSNVKRQKKFNELYHRILNAQLKKDEEIIKIVDQNKIATPTKKDIGLNFNISLSESEEKFKKT